MYGFFCAMFECQLFLAQLLQVYLVKKRAVPRHGKPAVGARHCLSGLPDSFWAIGYALCCGILFFLGPRI